MRFTGKQTTAVFLSAAVLMSALPAAVYGEADPETEFLASEEGPAGVEAYGTQMEEDAESATYEEKALTVYLGDMEAGVEVPFYFINDVTDLPYMNLSDWIDLAETMYQNGADGYDLELEADGPAVMLTRENGYSMLVDFSDRTIRFEDYDAFIHLSDDSSLLDEVSDIYVSEEGDPILIEKIQKGSFDRYGKEVELNLADYQIDLYWSEEDGIYLVPLQTLSDFLVSPAIMSSFFYNGDAVFVGDSDLLGLNDDELTPMGEALYSAPSGKMSEELAWYSYCELCLALDHLYGLKEIHDISSFDRVFSETGYKEDLCSADPDIKDGALNDFIYYYLDDMHSGFETCSYRTEEPVTVGDGRGLSSLRDSAISELYSQARDRADHPIESYEEVGNTAYITFDHFLILWDPEDYYAGEIEVEKDPSSATLDTAALITYANERITREDSPIENVVIDLSLNGGGIVDTAAFLVPWYLGEASISIRSSLTGAISTGTYRSDINLDRVFDEKDMLQDKRLFCMISPDTFSCGNLVTGMFRASGRVTLLGQESGGGSCFVLPMSTAYGSIFTISSPRRMSYLKNGSYYDTDTGFQPDVVIVKPENFYDREALTEYINHLF